MKIISKCHYCKSSEVQQISQMIFDKKMEATGRCGTCLKTWTETWTLTKLQKRNTTNRQINQEKEEEKVLTASS